MSELKIIQIQAMPNDECWQAIMLGLGSDGVTYSYDYDGWKVYAPAIKLDKKEEQ